jgi:two-component system, chemotaxis family, response regulator Rcp1
MSVDHRRPKTLLLVEDDPADVRLTMEGLRSPAVRDAARVVSDGEQALAFLRHEPPYQTAPRPDLVILDLNLPRRRGLDLLADIKTDQRLRSIPVVVLTTSDFEQDISACYARQANCFVTKPGDLHQYLAVIAAIEAFWLDVARLPEA